MRGRGFHRRVLLCFSVSGEMVKNHTPMCLGSLRGCLLGTSCEGLLMACLTVPMSFTLTF